MLFLKAAKFSYHYIISIRTTWAYIFRRPNQEIQHPTQRYPQNHLLGLPGELRNKIYRYLIDDTDTVDILRILHIDRLRSVSKPASNAQLACRQLYNELSGILAKRRLYPVSAFRQHCYRCTHYRSRFSPQSSPYRLHTGRDVHNNTTCQWYAPCRCPRCELAAHRMLRLSETELERIKRLVVPCCICNLRYWNYQGKTVASHKKFRWRDYSITGINPHEIILQCCTCDKVYPRAAGIGEAISYLDDYIEQGLISRFPELERIVVYYCHSWYDRFSFYRPPLGFFPGLVASKEWNDLNDDTRNPDDIDFTGDAVYHREKETGKGAVKIYFYSSRSIADTNCVFRMNTEIS